MTSMYKTMKNILKIIIVFWLTLQFCNVLTAQTSDTTSYQNYVNTNIVTNGTRSITATHLNYSLLSSMAISQKFRREFMDSVRAHRLRDFYNITANKISDWNTVFNWYNSNPLSSYAFANGSNASGTWPINISGNAATASSIPWTSVTGRPTALTDFSNNLGLGSYAYRSSGLAELTGATFTGAISGTSATFSGLLQSQRLLMSSYNSALPSGAISDYNLGISAGLYGLYTGVATSGNAWMQVSRTDSNTPYNLLIQPNGGNVGIGTTSPNAPLEILGANEGEYFRAGGGTITDRSLRFSSYSVAGLTGVGHRINAPNASANIAFAIDGSDKLTIASTGAITATSSITATSFSGSGSGLTGTAAGLTAGAVDWSGVTNKPATFTPSTHTHTWSDVTGKPNLQNGTFSPTYSNLDLCTAAATETNGQWFYTVVGNVVTVTGVAYITTTSANLNSSFQFTLPFTANSSFPYYGTGHVSAEVLDVGGNSYNADITLISTTMAKVTYRANYSGTTTLFISFSYTN